MALADCLASVERLEAGVKSMFIMSIMHTGTTFLKHVRRPDGLRHIHEQECLAEAVGAGTIAVPLRHPEKVWKSWKYRERPEPLFWYSWHLLDWYDRVYGTKMVYVPVDLPAIRDERLALLGERIGGELETDWAPRNEWKHERTKVEVPDLTPLWDYDVVRRHYDG